MLILFVITATDYITVLIKNLSIAFNTRKIFVKGVLQKFEQFRTNQVVWFQSIIKEITSQDIEQIKRKISRCSSAFKFYALFKIQSDRQIQAFFICVCIKQRVIRVGETRGSGDRTILASERQSRLVH